MMVSFIVPFGFVVVDLRMSDKRERREQRSRQKNQPGQQKNGITLWTSDFFRSLPGQGRRGSSVQPLSGSGLSSGTSARVITTSGQKAVKHRNLL